MKPHDDTAVLVTWTRNPLDPGARVVERHAWAPGLTPRALLPLPLRHAAVVPRCWAGSSAVEGEDWERQVAPGEHLAYGVQPQAFVAGAAVYAAVTTTTATLAATLASTLTFAAVAGALAKLALQIGLSLLVGKILGPSRKPVGAGDESSATYQFAPLSSNPRGEGAAIPVVYGEHDVAGVVINEATTSSIEATRYRVLLLLSEGAIESVGDKTEDGGPFTTLDGTLPEGLRINGQPATDFDDVRVHVRLGGLSQEPIPGFESTSQVADVAQDLVESAILGPGNVEIAPQDGGFDPGDSSDLAEIDKWDTAVAYTMSDPADAFTAQIRFPAGLFAINSDTGAIVANNAAFQIRYRQVDGSGTPFGNYVVLPPESQISLAKTGTFGVEFRHDFYDPATYVAPQFGRYLTFDGVNDHGTIAAPVGVPQQTESQTQVGFSAWVRLADLPTGFSTRNYRLMRHRDSSGGGWIANLACKRSPESSPSGFTVKLYLEVALYNAAGSIVKNWDLSDPKTLLYTATSSQGELTGWIHVGWTFRANYKGDGQGRGRWYYNGVLKNTATTSAAFVINPTAPFFLGVINTAGSGIDNWFKGDMDAPRWYGREMQPGEFAAMYAGGKGVLGTGSESDLIASWPLDITDAGPPITTPDLSPNANDLELVGGPVVSSGANFGPVGSTDSGTPLAGRYRIEIQRLDADDTQTNNQAVAEWDAILLTNYDAFTYPGSALLALEVRADGQLSGAPPVITQRIKGRKVPVWDGASTDFPTFVEQWSRAPAWCFLDALVNEEYGLGQYHRPSDLDVASFQELADFSAELVKDGRESLDISTLTSPFLIANVGAWTIQWFGADIPPHWKVGTQLALTGIGSAEWNTPDGTGATIVAFFYNTTTGRYDVITTWPSGVTAPISNYTPAAGFVRGLEARMEFDGIFDRADDNAWDAVLRIPQSARAVPVRLGRRISLMVDRARTPSAVVTMANMIPGSFAITYSGIDDRPNAVTIDILDRDRQFERVPVEREHPSVNDPEALDTSFRRRRISMEGVTRRSQALRHAVYQLNLFFLVRRAFAFAVGRDSYNILPGDIVRVSNDMPRYGLSGRVQTDGAEDEVTIDREVTIDGATWYVVVRNSLTDAIEERQVSTAAGTYPAGTAITVTAPFGFVPARGDLYAIGALGAVTKEVRVTSTRLSDDTLNVEIEGVEYNEDVYNDDFGDLLTQASAVVSEGLQQQTLAPFPVTLLQATESVFRGSDGAHDSELLLSWQLSSEPSARVATVDVLHRVRGDRTWAKIATVDGGLNLYRFRSRSFDRYTEHEFAVVPFDSRRRGRPIALQATTSIQLRGEAPVPAAPASISAAIVDGGDQATYRWTDTNASQVSGYDIRMGGWLCGQRVVQANRSATEFGPTPVYWSAPTNAAGVAVPPTMIRSALGTGQRTAGLSTTFSPDPPGRILWELNVEDEGPNGWSSAVFSNAARTSLTPGKPVQLSSLASAGFVRVDTPDFRVPQWVWVFVTTDAHQVHHATLEDLDFALGSIDGARWSMEGPLYTRPDEATNGNVRVDIGTSTDGTTPTTQRLYVPGLYYLRTARIRVGLNPSPSGLDNISLNRFVIRIVRPRPQDVDHIRQQVFGR